MSLADIQSDAADFIAVLVNNVNVSGIAGQSERIVAEGGFKRLDGNGSAAAYLAVLHNQVVVLNISEQRNAEGLFNGDVLLLEDVGELVLSGVILVLELHARFSLVALNGGKIAQEALIGVAALLRPGEGHLEGIVFAFVVKGIGVGFLSVGVITEVNIALDVIEQRFRLIDRHLPISREFLRIPDKSAVDFAVHHALFLLFLLHALEADGVVLGNVDFVRLLNGGNNDGEQKNQDYQQRASADGRQHDDLLCLGVQGLFGRSRLLRLVGLIGLHG